MTEALDTKTLTLMSEVFARYPDVQQVLLYGSRAKGTHHERSDIDITLVGENLDRFTVGAVQMDLDDLDIPWQVDAQSLHDLHNPALLEHINRVGRVIWSAE
ncbi:MAG: nucleotidyltransferase domain-containing protein [Pseudohongiellaceae bacterium]